MGADELSPRDDFVGNEAAQRMKIALAEVTARERRRGAH